MDRKHAVKLIKEFADKMLHNPMEVQRYRTLIEIALNTYQHSCSNCGKFNCHYLECSEQRISEPFKFSIPSEITDVDERSFITHKIKCRDCGTVTRLFK